MAFGRSTSDSLHSSSSLPSDPNQTDPTSSDAGESANYERASSTEKSAEALAKAAEASELAQKLRDRTLEQAIDKPTQEFKRKRSSSANSTVQEKVTTDRHDSAGGFPDLRPLAPVAGGTPNLSGPSHRRDTSDSDDAGEPTTSSNMPSIVDSKDFPPMPSSTHPGEPSPETKQDLSKQPIPEMAEFLVQPTSDSAPIPPKSPFAFPEPGKFYRMLRPLCNRFETINFKTSRKAWRLFEVCDFSWTPEVIRHTCQDILTQEWTSQAHVPYFDGELQPVPPAHIAAKPLEAVLREVFEKDVERDLEVFEFCAGSSGPTPTFERLINKHRTSQGERPIRFRISDKYPNLEAWRRLRGSSRWLDFVDISVDVIDPPHVAMSRGKIESTGSSREGLNKKSTKRVFRLFNCSFHHFSDEMAVQILKSTMDTSDGFAIIELQDRRLGMLVMMLCNWIFVCRLIPSPNRLRGTFWFSTYRLPRLLIGSFLWLAILIVLQGDGFVSCLRTREFDEFIQLVQHAAGVEGTITTRNQGEGRLQVYDLLSWEIRAHEQVLHTLPFGYVRMVTGVRKVPT